MSTSTALAVILLFNNLLSGGAQAAISPAKLDCASTDGLSVRGDVPGDHGEFDLTVAYQEKTARLYSLINPDSGLTEENASLAVAQDLAEGVWTLVAKANEPGRHGYFQIYALPRTVVYQSSDEGYDASFTATVYFTLPEISTTSFGMNVKCALSYRDQ